MAAYLLKETPEHTDEPQGGVIVGWLTDIQHMKFYKLKQTGVDKDVNAASAKRYILHPYYLDLVFLADIR